MTVDRKTPSNPSHARRERTGEYSIIKAERPMTGASSVAMDGKRTLVIVGYQAAMVVLSCSRQTASIDRSRIRSGIKVALAAKAAPRVNFA